MGKGKSTSRTCPHSVMLSCHTRRRRSGPCTCIELPCPPAPSSCLSSAPPYYSPFVLADRCLPTPVPSSSPGTLPSPGDILSLSFDVTPLPTRQTFFARDIFYFLLRFTRVPSLPNPGEEETCTTSANPNEANHNGSAVSSAPKRPPYSQTRGTSTDGGWADEFIDSTGDGCPPNVLHEWMQFAVCRLFALPSPWPSKKSSTQPVSFQSAPKHTLTLTRLRIRKLKSPTCRPLVSTEYATATSTRLACFQRH